MFRTAVLLLAFTSLFSGCSLKKEQEALRLKETALNQKEQELVVKEKELQLKEEALLKREQEMNQPAPADTAVNLNPDLLGNWGVTMTCTETTCAGSAVGDTKTEKWEISHQNDRFLARAMANDKLVRIYTGIYTGNTLELIAENSDNNQPPVKMIVRLRTADKNKLVGQREIIKPEGCKIIYELQLSKE